MERLKFREHAAPMIPAYFIDLQCLIEMLNVNPEAISDKSMALMLDFFEEFEFYEKAAVIRDARLKLLLLETNPTDDFETNNPFK